MKKEKEEKVNFGKEMKNEAYTKKERLKKNVRRKEA